MSEIVEYTFEELKKEMELLSPLYDVVRLVNPFKCEIIDINDTCLTPSDTPISCYDSWKCIFQCINCTSARTLLTGNIQSKLDVSDDTVYHVTSRPVRVNNSLLVLETVQHFSYTYRQLETDNTNNALISLIQNANRSLLLDEETGAYNRSYLSEHLPYELYKAVFSEAKIDYELDMEVATANLMLPLIQNDLGIGFVPEALAEPLLEKKELVQIDVDMKMPPRDIQMVWDKGVGKSWAAELFIKYLEK